MCFKDVSRKFQGCFKTDGDGGEFLESFNCDSRVLKGYLKEVQWVFQNISKKLKRKSMVLQEYSSFEILLLH